MAVPAVRPLLAVLLAALAGLTAVAGCSGGAAAPPEAAPAPAVRQAVAATRDAGVASVTVLSRTSALGQDVDVPGDGQLDLAAGAADLGLDVTALGGRTRVVFVGGTVYAALPPRVAGFVPGGKPWIAVDVDRLARSRYGASLAQLGAGVTGNPARQLGYLEGLRDDARRVGDEPVDGVPTTHYAGVVDLTRVPAAADPATRPAVDRLTAQLGTSALPIDVWVDRDGRLKRVTQTVTTPARDGGPETSASSTVTFTGFGLPGPVTAPPADQVGDLGGLLGGGLLGG